MRVSPLASMTAALIAGILAAPFLPVVPVWVALAVCLAFALTGVLLSKSGNALAPLLCCLAVFAVFGAASAKRCGTPAPDDVSRLAGSPSLWMTGTVAADPDTFDDGVRYPLRVTNANVSGILLVTQNENAGANPQVGDTVTVRGMVKTPPGRTNPGGFDYRAHLWRKGIFATLSAKRTGDARVIVPAHGVSVFRFAANIRRALLRVIESSSLSPDNKTLVAGTILSERGGISYADELAFERTGAVHILSVSGLHLAVFASVLAWGTRQLPASRTLRHAGNILAICLLWTFALAAGLSSATVRSAVMITILLAAPIVRRDADPLHSLVVAAFVILLFDPLAVYDIGLQLSLACVGGLVLWVAPLQMWLLPLERNLPLVVGWLRGAAFVFLTGLVVQGVAAPLMAFHFSTIPVIAPLANLVIVPLSEGLLLTAFVLSGLGATVPLPALAWVPVETLCDALRGATQFFATPEFAAVNVPPPSLPGVALFYVAFAGFSLVFRTAATRRTFFPDTEPRLTAPQLAVFPVAALLVLPVLTVLTPLVAAINERREANRLRVTFLDVGQGDAAVVETPDGAVIVVDGGGNPGLTEIYGNDPGARVVVPFLRSRGINRVTLLAPSHPDDDHVQGLVAVARAFPVETMLDGGIPDIHDDATNVRLRTILREKNVPTVTARRGQFYTLGTSGVAVEVLHPAEPFLTNATSFTNANSVVLRVSYKKTALLFTGDTEETAETALLKRGDTLRADVLKVGHHGSRSSSKQAFLNAIRPSIAVISCGINNDYGHPAPEVLHNLNAVGAKITRTDRGGAIVVESDGARVFVTPFVRD